MGDVQIGDPSENVRKEPSAPALPAKAAVQKSLETRENGGVSLLSLSDQLQFAQRLLNEGMVSNTFKNAQQVVIGFQYAKALQINEVIALKMMYVVNGKPCLYGEGPLALVQRNPAFSKINEYYINENGDEISPAAKNLKGAFYFGSVTKLWRAGDDEPQIDFFTLEDMERAGLDKNKWGKKETWEKFERIMLRYKARTLGLRSKFADLIAGIPVAEYDYHFTPEAPEVLVKTVNESQSKADEINAEYGGNETQTTAGQEPAQLS